MRKAPPAPAERAAEVAPGPAARAGSAHTSVGPAGYLALQRAAGNAAVSVASALAPDVRSDVEGRLGAPLPLAWLHVGKEATERLSNADAVGLTQGRDVYLPSRLDLGSEVGRHVLAHELTHVRQQTTPGSPASPAVLEGEAAAAASGTPAASPSGAAFGTAQALRRDELPVPESEVSKHFPDALTTRGLPEFQEQPDDVQRWVGRVREELEGWYPSESAIVATFHEAAKAGKFVPLHDRLNMDQVFEALDATAAVSVGMLGPVTQGRDLLNRRRVEFIVEFTLDSGARAAEVYIHQMFRRMYTDDLLEVLKGLSADARLATTIAGMPAIHELLRERGIEASWWSDRPARGTDFLRGAWEPLGQAAYAHNRLTNRALTMRGQLPPDYQAALDAVFKQEMAEHFSTSNVLKGSFDYMTLGTSSMVGGLVVDTPTGLYHLAIGDYEQAGAELTGAMVLIGTWGIAKGAKALGARGGGAAPESTAHTMPEYTGPKSKALARLEAIVRARGASGAAAAALAELTEAQLEAGGRYVREKAANAAFVSRGGLPALKALIDANGDLAAAERALRGQKALPSGSQPVAPKPASPAPAKPSPPAPAKPSSRAPLDEPSEHARGGPLSDAEREAAFRYRDRSLGHAQPGPAQVVRWPSKVLKNPPKNAPKVIPRAPGKPLTMEFTGRGMNGELITVRTIKGKGNGKVVRVKVDWLDVDIDRFAEQVDRTGLPKRKRDPVLPRAMKAAGMGNWRSNLGHIVPFKRGAAGADAPYNLEPQDAKWNQSDPGRANRSTLEQAFEKFVKANSNDIGSVEFSRELTAANALQSERFVVRNRKGVVVFDMEVKTRQVKGKK